MCASLTITLLVYVVQLRVKLSWHVLLLGMSLMVLNAGVVSYNKARRRYVQLSVCVATCGAALLALMTSTASPCRLCSTCLVPIIVATIAVCFAAAPVLFILGFAGFGSVSSALKEQEQSLQVYLNGC